MWLGRVEREGKIAVASTLFADPDAVLPAGLATDELVLRPIVAADAVWSDVDAVVYFWVSLRIPREMADSYSARSRGHAALRRRGFRRRRRR